MIRRIVTLNGQGLFFSNLETSIHVPMTLKHSYQHLLEHTPKMTNVEHSYFDVFYTNNFGNASYDTDFGAHKSPQY